MEALTVIAVVISILIVAIITRKGSTGPISPPVTPPLIPDHQAEKPGDVNNGATFSSFSFGILPHGGTVENKQQIYSKGRVIATNQIHETVNEVVLGNIIMTDANGNLPTSLRDYKFNATIVGSGLTTFNSFGRLDDLPMWLLSGLSGSRPQSTFVYLEIEAPEGYKGGVVVLQLRVEAGM